MLEYHAVLDLALHVVHLAGLRAGFVGLDEESMVVLWDAGFDDEVNLIGHGDCLGFGDGKGPVRRGDGLRLVNECYIS